MTHSLLASPISRRRAMASLGVSAAAATGLAGCRSSEGGGGAGDRVEITLAGPNQWTNSGESFGPAWDDLIAAFEKEEPGIKVNTNVLPLKTFFDTISTQLSAGTAPELVFNQATYQPYMVHQLDDELAKPNPYVPGNEKWIDLFDSDYFGYDTATSIDVDGHINWIPFNLVGVALFYNKDVFDKVGVEVPTTFAELLSVSSQLKSAGYTPFAGENSDISVSWSVQVIYDQLMDRHYDDLDYFDANGEPGGSTPQITVKDLARAIALGTLTTQTPELVETLRLTKQFYDECVTPDWSGIAGNSGALVGIRQFSTEEAAMTWGTDFATSAIPDVPFAYASAPFPTITDETSPLSQNVPARWGVSAGGTSYMIPAKTSGEKLEAAIKFLQFVSAPDKVKPWLDATGAVSALSAIEPGEAAAGFTQGEWGTLPRLGALPGGPPGTTMVSLYDGYLLGTKSLEEEQTYLQDLWDKGVAYQVKTNEWDDEDWAKDVE